MISTEEGATGGAQNVQGAAHSPPNVRREAWKMDPGDGRRPPQSREYFPSEAQCVELTLLVQSSTDLLPPPAN